MINPISSVHPAVAHQVLPAAENKPEPHAQTPPVQKSGALSHDQVTLRSTEQPDHDSDQK